MKDPKDDDQNPRPPAETAQPEEEARRIILARRARFVAAALASAGIATASCGGETTGDGSPEPCLSIGASGGQYNDGGIGGAETSTGGRQGGSGGMPMPCLSPPQGGMYGAGGMPMPCLSPPLGGAGGVPQPCLDIVPTGGAGGAPSDAGPDATDAGAAPLDAAIPVPCLSIPQIESPNGQGEGEGS